jgi:hypothetical protein
VGVLLISVSMFCTYCQLRSILIAIKHLMTRLLQQWEISLCSWKQEFFKTQFLVHKKWKWNTRHHFTLLRPRRWSTPWVCQLLTACLNLKYMYSICFCFTPRPSCRLHGLKGNSWTYFVPPGKFSSTMSQQTSASFHTISNSLITFTPTFNSTYMQFVLLKALRINRK